MIELKRVPRGNPQDLTAPVKHYAQVVPGSEVSMERLAYLVSNQCTVREADCLAVLTALVHNVQDELSQGRTVDLGVLGRLRVGVRSNGYNLPEEVTSAAVKKAHIIFKPGKRLRDMLATAKFRMKEG